MKSPCPTLLSRVIRRGAAPVSVVLLFSITLVPSFVLAQTTEAPVLQYSLPEDPHDQPLLRRSIIIEDEELRSIELRVDDYERQKILRKKRERIFFEDIESLDESPFFK